MYCKLSRNPLMSQGLCSISNTIPSYLAVAIAMAVSASAWQNDVNACLPDSKARITPLRRGMSAMLFPLRCVVTVHPKHVPQMWKPILRINRCLKIVGGPSMQAVKDSSGLYEVERRAYHAARP